MNNRYLLFNIPLLLLLSIPIRAEADAVPNSRPGLWQSTNFDANGNKLQTSTSCVSAESEARLRKFSRDASARQSCPKSETTKTDKGYKTYTECAMMGSKSISTATIVGDFQSAYTITTVTTMRPPVMGVARSYGRTEMKWLGECPSTMRPGDVSVDGRSPVNGVDSALRGRKIHDDLRKRDPDFDKMVRELSEGNGHSRE
jgi:hypothetical protein